MEGRNERLQLPQFPIPAAKSTNWTVLETSISCSAWASSTKVSSSTFYDGVQPLPTAGCLALNLDGLLNVACQGTLKTGAMCLDSLCHLEEQAAVSGQRRVGAGCTHGRLRLVHNQIGQFGRAAKQVIDVLLEGDWSAMLAC